MKGLSLTIVLCLLAHALTAAETAPELPSYGEFVDGLLDHPSLCGSSWSVLIYSLDGDSVIYERDPDRRLIPASVAKLVTSAAALDALGPDYRFTTTVTSTRPLDTDGSLHGDLVVHAGGDPTIDAKYVDSLRAPILLAWADSLKARGLTRVDGNIVMKTLPYRLQVSSPEWEVGDVNDRFGPCVDGFGYHSNVCQVSLMPGDSAGDGVLFSIDPPYAPVSIHSRVVTVENGVPPYVEFRIVPEDTVVYLTGAIPLGDDGEYLWLSVQDPALYFGRALYEALLDREILVSGDIIVNRFQLNGADENMLYVHQSPPLSEVIKLMNKESDNYTSEYVLRVIGAGMFQFGDLRNGLLGIQGFLQKLGLSENDIHSRDGCGLSRQNLCSARGIVELLKAMYAHPFFQPYIESMAVSGTDGTIGFRMNSLELVGRVHAKTGTITHVANLAGYMYTADGRPVVFAMLCNNFPSDHRHHVRMTQDNILERLYAHTFRNHTSPRP